ncbi:S100 calcium binding protein U [Gouania willdenowi]|uniref:Translation initiation factor IF-2-like n=1 Tax=Gouania willdenowi TaxID=441366 RepID=A0A8C5G0W6_GOUWI|nr:uncharacterized protein LOC114471955 [Gouania willdenowi]
MENAIQTMVKTFLKSSKGKENLGKKEFQNLVSSQLGNILSDSDSKEAINNMSQGLDANQDGKVGFEEYLKLVGYLAVSLSDQRCLAQKEQNQNSNAATGQVAQSSPETAEEKPEANAEAKPAAKEDAEAVTSENAVESVKVDVKAEGEAAVEEAMAAAAVVSVAVAEAAEEAEAEAEAEAKEAVTAIVAAAAVEMAVEEAMEEAVIEAAIEEKAEEDAVKLLNAIDKEITEATS